MLSGIDAQVVSTLFWISTEYHEGDEFIFIGFSRGA
jgi:uncharacterized protein (DUF2235 family)